MKPKWRSFMAEQWLSIVEYARKFAISDMTVRRRIKNGKIKAILKEGKYYIPSSGRSDPLDEEKPSPSVFPVELNEKRREFNGASQRSESRWSELSHTNSLNQVNRSKTIDNDRIALASNQMMEMCEKLVEAEKEKTRLLEIKYREEIKSLETKVQSTELLLKNALQQSEDLQVLVKLFENQSY